MLLSGTLSISSNTNLSQAQLAGYDTIEIQSGVVLTIGDATATILTDQLSLGTNAQIVSSGALTISADDISLASGAVLSARTATINAQSLSISSTARIHADGLGHNASNPGPAQGIQHEQIGFDEWITHNGGGGHGGVGYPSRGITYGSATAPTTWGSAGYSGTAGGGAIRVNAVQTLTLNGTISANGLTGNGGGAGGSVWVSAGFITGSGSLHANGGVGQLYTGGGGGGRVAVYFGDKTGWTGQNNISASGGAGWRGNGATGSVYQLQNFPPVAVGDNVTTSGEVITFDVRINDSDPDSNPLTTRKLTDPAHGTLLTNNFGIFQYIPDAGYYGADSFVYELSDGSMTGTAVVNINVLPGPPQPTGRLDVVVNTTLSQSQLAGYDVIKVHNAAVLTISDSTATITTGELVLGTNSQLISTGVLTISADEVTLESGAVLTARTASIHTRSLVVANTARLHADGLGHNTANPGPAPGLGVVQISYDEWVPYYGGGSHGGSGYNASGGPYGSASFPTTWGSAGYSGTAGGGAIRVVATEALTLNGTITANGLAGNGGGAGGSVWISVATMTGSGTIQAKGGNGLSNTSGGGGGRVAVHYQDKTGWTGQNSVSVAGGIGSYGNGNAGTIHQALNHSPVAVMDNVTTSGEVISINVLSNDVDTDANTLTTRKLSNPANGTLLTNDLGIFQYKPEDGYFGTDSFTYEIFDGNLTSTAVVNITVLPGPPQSTGRLDIVVNTTLSQSELVGYDVIEVHDGAVLTINDSVTTITTDQLILGANSQLVSSGTLTISADDISLGSGAVLSARTATINAQSLSIASTARLHADGLGHNASNPGPAPGRSGVYWSSDDYWMPYNGGGSHGGAGYNSSGGAYGSASAPITWGSAGYSGTAGGGAIRVIVTQTLTLNGTMTANGLTGNGGGAGGSVWVSAGTITGSGTIQAKGGNGSPSTSGGGGGRIAVYYQDKNGWTGQSSISVSGGSGPYGNGSAGSTLMQLFNSAPFSRELEVVVYKGQTKELDLNQLVGDAENDELVITSVGNAIHGDVTLDENILLYVASEDYLGVDSFELQVSDGQLTSTVLIRIVTVDPDLFAPRITGPNEARISESATSGNLVQFAYSLGTVSRGGEENYQWILESDKFAIDSTTGEIRLKSGVTLDYESDREFVVDVFLSDGVGRSNAHRLTIKILDENDTAPVIEGSTHVLISEDLQSGTVLPFAQPLRVVDPDDTNTFTWNLASDTFQIDSQTGEIRLRSDAQLDYELQTEFELIVTVFDGQQTSSHFLLTVEVQDANDVPPVIVGSQIGMIYETSQSGFVYLDQRLSIQNPRATSNYVWHVDSSKFEITEFGSLKLKSGEQLSFGTQSVYEVEVTVTDGTLESASHTLSIHVLPKNYLINGSFEDNPINYSWDIFYAEDNFSGWQLDAGPSIEVHDNAARLASDGNYYLELDADENGPEERWNENPNDRRRNITGTEDGSSRIRQTVNVIPGRTYLLEFDFAGRPGSTAADNVLEITIEGATTSIHQLFDRDGDDDWSHESFLFQANDGTITIKLGDVGINNTQGTLLDNVLLWEVLPERTAVQGRSSVVEGQTYSLDLITYQTPYDSFTSWTVDWGDGTVETFSGTATRVSHIYEDGDAQYEIRAFATADGQDFPEKLLEVDVENAPPSIILSGSTNTIIAQPYVLGIDISDPGSDTITQLIVDWGDGTVETISSTSISATHTYSDVTQHEFSIRVTAIDEDGTWHSSNKVIEPRIRLIESNEFLRSFQQDLVIPYANAAIVLSFDELLFDQLGHGNLDAFELAIVDSHDRPLVIPISASSTAFFNLSEGQPTWKSSEIFYDSENGRIVVDLKHLSAGTSFKVIARLLNNDNDVLSEVLINPVSYFIPSTNTAMSDYPTETSNTTERVNLNSLRDVSNSIEVEHLSSTWSDVSSQYEVRLKLLNVGQQRIAGPLYLVVDNITQFGVAVSGTGSHTTSGLPVVFAVARTAQIETGEASDVISLKFENPSMLQFGYRLRVFGETNSPPSLEAIPDATIAAGSSYSYQAIGKDAPHDVLNYQLLVAPSGMIVNASTGLITWTTTQNDIADHYVTLRVNDAMGLTDEVSWKIQVEQEIPNRPPIVREYPSNVAYYGHDYQSRVIAYDPDNDILNYEIVNGPAGFQVNAQTGVLTWTPSSPVEQNQVSLTIRISDPHDGVVEFTHLISLFTSIGNQAPAFVSQPPTHASNGSEYRYEVRVIDPENDQITISLTDETSLPPGFQLQAISGSTYLTFTPAGYQVGDVIPVSLTAVDTAGNTVTQQFTITIAAWIGHISGRTWNDTNGNGIFDSNETGLAGVQVYLDLDNNSIWTPDEPFRISQEDNLETTEIDETGYYIFDQLEGGTEEDPLIYAVRQITKPYYFQTSPELPTTVVSLDGANPSFTVEDIPAGELKTIDFTEFPHGTVLRDQYVGLGYGARFGGYFTGQTINQYVVSGTPDVSWEFSPNSPNTYVVRDEGAVFDQYSVTGSPFLYGPVSILFDQPQAFLAFHAGFIDQSNTVLVRYYNVDGDVIGERYLSQGYEYHSMGSPDGRSNLIKAVQFIMSPGDPSGFGVEDISFWSKADATHAGSHYVPVGPTWPLDDWNFGSQRNPSVPLGSLDFISDPPEYAYESQTYRYLPQVFSEDDLPVTVSLIEAPRGMFIDPATKILYWNPTASDVGDHVVRLIARDSQGRSVIQEYVVKVAGKNSPVAFTTFPRIGVRELPKATYSIGWATENHTWSYQFSAHDPDGDLITYFLAEAPEGAYIDSVTQTLYWTPQSNTTAFFRLIASDARGGDAFQEFWIPVLPGNAPPQIVTSPLTHTNVDELYSYTLAAIDIDANYILSWELDQASLDRGMSIDSNGVLTWIPETAGKFQVTVKVRDEASAYDSQTFTLDVIDPLAENTPPVITSSPVTVAMKDRIYRYQVIAEDANYDTLTFEIMDHPAHEGMTISESGLLTWTPSYHGTIPVQVKVTDEHGASAFQTFELVILKNAPPVIVSQPVIQVSVSTTYSYQVQAEDPNPNDSLEFRLAQSPAGMSIDTQSGLITWEPETVGSYTVEVEVKDSHGESHKQRFQLAVVNPLSNNPPLITSEPREQVQSGRMFSHQFEVANEPGETFTFKLIDGPQGMLIDQSGRITWSTSIDDISSSPHSYTIKVTDASGLFSTKTFSLHVTTEFVNSPPAFTTSPPTTSAVGTTYKYQPTVTDPDGDLIYITLVEAPTGMTFDQRTGLLGWVPQNNQIGEHTVRFIAVDSFGLSTVQQFSIHVRASNSSPVITSIPPVRAIVTREYLYQIRAEDSDGDQLTFSLDSASVGRGIQIDPTTGLLEWTNPVIGENIISVTVTDSLGLSSTQSYLLKVVASAPNSAPEIHSVPPLDVEPPQTYSYQIEASDPDGDAITYALRQTPNLPPDVSFNTTTGLLEWTATSDYIGQYVRFEVAAVDIFGRSAIQNISVYVNTINFPPDIVSTPPTVIQQGETYLYMVKARDLNQMDFFDVTVNQESVDLGMTVDSNSLIIWNTQGIAAGLYDVEIYVTDNRGVTSTQSFQIEIIPDTVAPIIQFSASNRNPPIETPFFIKLTSWDSVGVVTQTHAVTAHTVNGVRTELNRPIVLNASGIAELAFENAGTYEITATATDAAGNITTLIETIFVSDPSDTMPPTALIHNITNGDKIEQITDIVISVSDNEPSLLNYRLILVDNETATQTVLATGTGIIDHGVAAQIDTTRLANGSYRLILTATDAGGQQSVVSRHILVESDFKLGNLSVTFEDIQTSIATLPVTITRTYNSIESQRSSDFGYGWTVGYKVATIDIFYSSDRSNGFSNYPPLKIGDRVVVTMPDGSTEGFTFAPIPGAQSMGIAHYWIPNFIADIGVDSRLEVDQVRLARVGDEFIAEDLAYDYYEYSPLNPYFGSGQFRLTTSNNTQFVFSAQTEALQSITDPYGRKFYFTEDRIYDDQGSALTFQRDYAGRITSITDHTGRNVTYQYDSKGDLVAVIDVHGQTTRFKYNTTVSHRLQEITDPLGRPTARTEYDAQGRVSKMIDADGKTIQYAYDTETRIQTITNQLGYVSQVTLDQWGNAIREVSPEGVLTIREFDHVRYGNSKDRLLSETIVIGDVDDDINDQNDDLTTRYQYDSHGNQTAVIDPRGHISFTSFNYLSLPNSIQDMLGNVTAYTYHSNGLIASAIDPSGNKTTFSYDSKGQLVGVSSLAQTLLTNTYDNRGQLIRTDAPGVVTHYRYDSHQNQILTWTQSLDENGQAVDIVTRTYFNAQDLPAQTVRAVYPHNDRFALSSFANDPHLVTLEADYVQWTTSTTYDALGQVLSSTDEQRLVTEYTYDRRGQQVQVRRQSRNENGQIVWFVSRNAYDEAGQLIASTEAYREGTNQPIRGTLSTYDGDGNVVQTTSVVGLQIQLFQSTSGQAVTGSTITLPSAGNLSTRIVTTGTTLDSMQSVYDTSGRLTSTIDYQGLKTFYTYDRFGDLVETRREARNELGKTVFIVSRTVYDEFGRVSMTLDDYVSTKATAAAEFVSPTGLMGTRSVYDHLGRVVRTERLHNVVLTMSAPDDVTAGLFASSVTSTGSLAWSSQTVYNQLGQVSRTVAADGQVTDYEYDALGRQTAVIGQAVTINGQSVRHRTETVYDTQGRVATQRSNIAQLANGTLDRSAQQQTSYVYDASGNLLRTIFHDDTFISATYDVLGRKTSETNQLGQTRNFEYDEAGRLMAVILPEVILAGVAVTPRYEYGYDAFGNQILLRDPLGRETRWVYDDQGNLLARTLPLGFGEDGVRGTGDDPVDWTAWALELLATGSLDDTPAMTERFVYDDLGRQILHVSFEGVVTQTMYNLVTGQVQQQRVFESLTAYESGSLPSERTSYTYNALGQVIKTVHSRVNQAARTETSLYDAQHRLQETRSPEGVIRYEYDALGRRTKTQTYTADGLTRTGESVTTYDALGRMATVTNTKGTSSTADDESTSYQYDLIGNLDLEVSPDGVITDYVYDDLNRLEEIVLYQSDSTPETLADNDKLAKFDYTVRDDGKRTGLTETFWDSLGASKTNTYAWDYDALGRLTKETIDHSDNTLDQEVIYLYDAVGNRLQKTVDLGFDGSIDETEVSLYDVNDRLLEVSKTTSAGTATTTYVYDQTQQTGKTERDTTNTITSTTTYSYNLQGRMSEVVITTGGVTKTTAYTYDTQGFRVKVTTEEGSTEYLVDRQTATGYEQTLRETHKDGSGAVTKTVDYTFGLDEISQTVTEAGQPAETHVFHHDGHGSVRVLTDLAGVVLEIYGFDAYGNALGFETATALTSILYSGESFDSNINQQYLRARWYDASTGRFNRLDPFFGNQSDPQSFHKYLYTHADPVNGIDPNGKFTLGSTLGSIGIGSFIAGTLGGAAAGIINGGIGLARGQMDLQTAIQTFARYTLLGAAAGTTGALMALTVKLSSLGVLGAGAARALFGVEVIAGGVALTYADGILHTWYQNPNTVIRNYKLEINAAAESENIPPDLLAAVLLAELNDYGVTDLLFDDEVIFAPERHSIGIAQLRIDNVRNWNLRIPEFNNVALTHVPAHQIRAALQTDTAAIELLAQFVRRAADIGPTFDNAYIGFKKGQPLSFDNWAALSPQQRSAIAFYYGNAKDDLQGQLVQHGLLQADVTYNRVLDQRLLQ